MVPSLGRQFGRRAEARDRAIQNSVVKSFEPYSCKKPVEAADSVERGAYYSQATLLSKVRSFDETGFYNIPPGLSPTLRLRGARRIKVIEKYAARGERLTDKSVNYSWASQEQTKIACASRTLPNHQVLRSFLVQW